MNFSKKHSNKIIAGVVTLSILTVLVLSGPANAFILDLSSDVSSAEKPHKIVFTAKIDIKNNENLPIDEIVLVLDGPEYRECKFDITGKMKSGSGSQCFGINIKKIPLPQIDYGYGYGYGYNLGYGYGYNLGYGYGYDFGYGYGYTEQTLEYEITLHTQHFQSGTYDTRLDVKINDKTFSKTGNSIAINDKEETENFNGGGCVTQWKCGEWSECSDGKQTRTCEKQISYCYASPVPLEQNCDEGNNEENSDQGISEKNTGKNRVSGITGAVVGAVGDTGFNVIVVFLVTLTSFAVVVPVTRAIRNRK